MLLCAAAVAVPSLAADYTQVGVENGDWVGYSYTLSSSGTGSMSGTARIDITQVSGTHVTVSYKVTYSSLSVTQNYTGDISTGSGGICSFVIAAGLSAGDLLYMGAPFTINETISMYIAGASRTLNTLAISVAGASMNLWFDKETGMLLKESLVSSGTTMSIEATSTSAFSADLAPLLILGGIGVGAAVLVLVIVVAYSVNRRKRRAEHVSVVPITLTAAGPVKQEEAPKQARTSSESVCPFCGTTIVAGAAFCASCGTRLEG
jgi:multisubunit Na+/H+ antiporter MnhC subunit